MGYGGVFAGKRAGEKVWVVCEIAELRTVSFVQFASPVNAIFLSRKY